MTLISSFVRAIFILPVVHCVADAGFYGFFIKVKNHWLKKQFTKSKQLTKHKQLTKNKQSWPVSMHQ